jgi:hypothetical protein
LATPFPVIFSRAKFTEKVQDYLIGIHNVAVTTADSTTDEFGEMCSPRLGLSVSLRGYWMNYPRVSLIFIMLLFFFALIFAVGDVMAIEKIKFNVLEKRLNSMFWREKAILN